MRQIVLGYSLTSYRDAGKEGGHAIMHISHTRTQYFPCTCWVLRKVILMLRTGSCLLSKLIVKSSSDFALHVKDPSQFAFAYKLGRVSWIFRYLITRLSITSTCCRKAISWLVPHLSGFGRLRSFRYSTSLSQSFGRYTRPVFELITMQDCWSFWRTCMGVVWALQCTTATWVERSCSKQCLNKSLP